MTREKEGGSMNTQVTCKMCKQRDLPWSGAPPKCAFYGEFTDNWNCATLNAIRDICYEGQELPHGVDYQYCDDRKYATINIDQVEDQNGGYIGLALWVSWYKSRGTTDAVWVLSDDSPPRRPTEEELLAIIAHYEHMSELNGSEKMETIAIIRYGADVDIYVGTGLISVPVSAIEELRDMLDGLLVEIEKDDMNTACTTVLRTEHGKDVIVDGPII